MLTTITSLPQDQLMLFIGSLSGLSFTIAMSIVGLNNLKMFGHDIFAKSAT